MRIIMKKCIYKGALKSVYVDKDKAEKVFADNADMIGTETLAVSVQKAEPAGYVKSRGYRT